jgi:hypothetical protein
MRAGGSVSYQFAPVQGVNQKPFLTVVAQKSQEFIQGALENNHWAACSAVVSMLAQQVGIGEKT